MSSVLLGVVRRVPRRLLGWLFVAASVAFLAVFLRNLKWSALAGVHPQWGPLLAATVVAVGFRYWGVLVWRTILADLGARQLPRFTILSDVYARAWIGRYIPGTVAWIAGKVYLASSHGIGRSKLAVSSVVEGGMQIVALMTVSMLILGTDSRSSAIPADYKLVMLVLAVATLAALTPPVFNALMRLGLRVMRRGDAAPGMEINARVTVHAYLLYAVASFILGLAEFGLTRSIAGTGWTDFLFVVGAFNLAGATGMLALFVPSGIGVRESVLLALLSVIMTKELALLVVIVSRLWGVVADVLFLGAATAGRALHDH